MRLIGALASGETLPADEAADGLMILNQMLDSWLAERLMAFTSAVYIATGLFVIYGTLRHFARDHTRAQDPLL